MTAGRCNDEGAGLPPDMDVWFPHDDPIFSLVIDASGGRSIFDLDEAEAGELLMRWWRHNRHRYRRWLEVRRRRAAIALAPPIAPGDRAPEGDR